MIRLIHHGIKNKLPALLAIPGIDGSIGSIAPIVRELSKIRQVIVVDYSNEENETLEELAAEIALSVKTTQDDVIDVLGQSIGTVLAAQVASLHEVSVRHVILCCTFTRLNWTTLRLSNFFLKLTPGWLYRLTTRPTMSLVCGPVHDGKDHPFFEASKGSDKAGVIKRTSWEIKRDFSDDLAKVKVPLLILMGEKDRFVPNAKREIEKLQKLFASHSAKVLAIPKAGHVLLPSEAVSHAVGHIENFLESGKYLAK